LNSLYHGVPGADVIVTYDYNKWIEDMYTLPDKYFIGKIYSA
jgi:DNA adenine methylase